MTKAKPPDTFGDAQNKYGRSLLPCPFCGSTPRIEVFLNRAEISCRCDTAPVIKSGSPMSVIRAWNTRNRRTSSELAKQKAWEFLNSLHILDGVDLEKLKHLVDYVKFQEGQNIPGIRSPL